MRTRPDGPSLRQLRAFEAVARCSSIGAAAQELGLSQPAVTQMIAQLEAVLAASPLERRPSGSFLTSLGRVLLPRVQRLFQAIQYLRKPLWAQWSTTSTLVISRPAKMFSAMFRFGKRLSSW